MTFTMIRTGVALAAAVSLSLIEICPAKASGPPSGLTDQPVVIAKPARVLSNFDRNYLTSRGTPTVRVWVFFTDKGFRDQRGFRRAAASVQIAERTMRRRAKVGRDRVLFLDLPVNRGYVDTIAELGGRHRRDSRWLNAASFEMSMSVLEEVAALPFVATIKPMLAFSGHGDREYGNEPERDRSPGVLSPDVLNYGPSIGQLSQINVPALHNMGLSGKGVTLAILDTGFRKSHQSFSAHWANNRVLAEYDFIFNDSNTANEPADGDAISQWSHGTLIWSVSGGRWDGSIYGPAYEASFILCKTEDVRSETPVEEDNWVAALEWVESLGADVVTSSLGYILWYTYDSLDGVTATTSIAASMADSLGVIVCNAMGNDGPGSGSLIAPADAFDILAVGAVNSSGTIASFSSRGPTFDGRIKPEVCAQGVNTYAASAASDEAYTTASGTSLSTPLVAGAVCLLIQAQPLFTPGMIRQELLETASNAAVPNNTYGWGIIDARAALDWWLAIGADTTQGEAPLTVNFTGTTALNATSWLWDFSDGETSALQNPTHTFVLPGVYTVTLTIQTDVGEIVTARPDFIAALGDTLWVDDDSAFAGSQVVLSIGAQNSQTLSGLIVPLQLGGTPFTLALDSAGLGARSSHFAGVFLIGSDETNSRYVFQLDAPLGGTGLDPGRGEVMKVYATIEAQALGGLSTGVEPQTVASFEATFTSDRMSYNPYTVAGTASTKSILRGDVNYSNDGVINILDLVYLINYIFAFGPEPVTLQSADVDGDMRLILQDIFYLIDYLFLAGPAPPFP